MKTFTKISLIAMVAIATACPAEDDGRANEETGGMETDDPTTTTTMSTTTMSTTTTTMTSTTLTTDPTMTTDPTDTDTTTGDDGYAFEEDDPSEYAQIDRMGMPAVATAVISDKDDYNQAAPADDAAGVFVKQIVANLTGIHEALDDDLEGLGLTPCGIDTCVAQGAPLVVPDVIRVDFTAPSGFPNGRLLDDPVVDITLAVVLLDLTVHDVTLLAELPLNPAEGDNASSADFPFYAAPN